MKKIVSSFALLALLCGSASVWAARVAVVDFDNKTPHGDWRIGQGAADMLSTQLVKKTKFQIYERDKLASILQEQDFGTSGRIDPSSAPQLGKILGVQYIVTGAVTEYGDSSQGGYGKGVGLGKKGYHAAVDIRIVNVETGEIVFADTGEGDESSLSVSFKGIGGGEKFNDKKATEAMRKAINSVADKIARAKLSGSASGGGSASATDGILIADVDGKAVMLNKGANAGLAAGDTVVVKRKGKVIKDPATGKVLKVKYDNIGKIKLTSVEAGYAEGTVVSGSGFVVGDTVAKK